ncbi:hypothetical protein EBR96_09990, partial [bacterium]|nr:hypothetical protein [bacterium]
VLFVFEYGSLTVSRGDGLRDALHSLAEYLPEDLIFFPKIVTVVTKCDAGFSTDKMLEQLARFSKSLTDPQAAQVMTVLLKSSIILFDPMDRGEGRRFVLDQILGARPISSDQFRFTADYETKQHLNGLCNVVVTTYSAVIAQIQLKLISYLRRCEALLPVEADYLKINAELDALPKSVEERLAQIDLDIKETDLKIGEMATKHAVSLLEDEELDHRPSQQRRQPNHRYRETLEERIGEADRRQSQNRLNYDRCKEILANQVRDLAQKLEAIRPEYDRLNKEKEQARENLQTYIEYHQSEMKEFQLISMLYGYGVLSEPSREVKKLLGIMELLSNSLNS